MGTPRIKLIFEADHTMDTDSLFCRDNPRTVVWADRHLKHFLWWPSPSKLCIPVRLSTSHADLQSFPLLIETCHTSTFSCFMQICGTKQRCWGLCKPATKEQGPGMVPKERQEEQGWCGEQGDGKAAAPMQPGSGVSLGLSGRAVPAKTATLVPVPESATSLPVLSCGLGHHHCAMQMLCPSSSQLCCLLLSLAQAKSCSTSALPSPCPVALNQKPAPKCVCKRCPNSHFWTPKWAL